MVSSASIFAPVYTLVLLSDTTVWQKHLSWSVRNVAILYQAIRALDALLFLIGFCLLFVLWCVCKLYNLQDECKSSKSSC